MIVGQAFPNFSLPNQDGKTVTFDDFKGKWLVVYVYPKDDTPGHHSGKIVHRFEVGSRNRGGRCQCRRRRIPQELLRFTIDLLADTGGTAQRHERPERVQGNDVLEPDQLRRRPRGNPAQGVLTPEGHEQVLLTDIKALQVSRSGGTCPPVRHPAIGMCWSGFWCRQARGLAIMGYGASEN